MKCKISFFIVALITSTALHAAKQSGKIGPNAQWNYDTSTKEFRISGSGATYDGTYSYNAMYQASPRPIKAIKATTAEPSGSITFQYGAAKYGNAYSFDPSQVKSIVVEEGITSIGEWTCAFFYNAQTVQLPSTLKKIGGGAFLKDSLLTSITIPQNVDTMKVAICESQASMYGNDIPMGAFFGCTHLKTVYWNAHGNTGDNIVQPLQGLENILTRIVLGSSVVHIPEKLCVNFTKLTGELRFERNVKTLGYAAFAGCANINKITLLADSMATLPTAFWNSYYYSSIYTNNHGAPFAMCNSNMEIFIGKNVKYIGEFMFSNYDKSGKSVAGNPATYTISKHNYVDSLRVTFEAESNLKVIASYAFAGVKGLENLSLPNTVEEIKPNAFYSTDLHAITIPSTIRQIGTEAFSMCPSLSLIQYNAENAYLITNGTNTSSGWEYIYKSPFTNCADSIVVTIGKEVQSIPSFMFSGCSQKEIYKNGWTNTFYATQRSDIKKVIIDEQNSQLSRIEDYAFSGCNALHAMTIPGNVYYIGDSAFMQCTNVDTFFVKSDYPPSLGQKVFPIDAKIKVNCVAKEDYINDNNWNVYDIGTDCMGGYIINFYQTQPYTFLLQSVQVAPGDTPVYSGQIPTIEPTEQYDYTFTNWISYDDDWNIIYGLQPANSSKSYFANFAETLRKYTITFLYDSDSILSSSQWEYGTIPTCENPTKNATYLYSFTFSGWSPEVVAVTGDATYMATFSSTMRKYMITFLDEDGTELCAQEWEFGAMPYCSEPTKADDEQYTYTFAGWIPKLVDVTDEATYVASYKATKKQEGFDNIEAGDNVQKILLDGTIFILRGNRIYTLQGQLVK